MKCESYGIFFTEYEDLIFEARTSASEEERLAAAQKLGELIINNQKFYMYYSRQKESTDSLNFAK